MSVSEILEETCTYLNINIAIIGSKMSKCISMASCHSPLICKEILKDYLKHSVLLFT